MGGAWVLAGGTDYRLGLRSPRFCASTSVREDFKLTRRHEQGDRANDGRSATPRLVPRIGNRGADAFSLLTAATHLDLTGGQCTR